MFVAEIVDNDLGRCIEVDHVEAGIDLIKNWIHVCEYTLTEEQKEELESVYTYTTYNKRGEKVTFVVGDFSDAGESE